MRGSTGRRLAHLLGSHATTRRGALAGVSAFLLGVPPISAQTPEATEDVPPEAVIELPHPRVVSSRDGVFRETFNGVVPGHTWEVRPGDTMQIDLINGLPPLPPEEHVDLTRPHEWTTTNLHTHGLHVSPSGNSDNVFLEIEPGETQQYEISIPDDHTGGLFWYHPHKHGGVCQQVRAGMAGALIVRGEIDEVPEIAAAREQVMVLQAIELGDDFQLLDPIPHPSKTEAFFPRTQILYTVNGVLNPRVTMYPDEVQRWRLLNAAEGKFMSVTLEGHDLNTIAWDGLTMHAPEAVSDLMMSGGNRVDVLIKAGEPGIYQLVLTPGSSQRPDIPGMDTHDHATPDAVPTPISSGEFAARSILTLEVTGSGPEMSLPASLPAYDPPILPIARTRDFAYTVERDDDNEFIDFGVNGEPFHPDRAPYQVKLGTAEEWTLVNDTDPKLESHAHAFHIHVNPFKVTRINGETLERPLWRDTMVLTGQDGDSITFQINFDDFTGTFVDHCHVLSHEDLGMMEAIEVIE
jgi:FtsP/CotA-like multicopper oxidase with cupredoxin domain